MVEKQQSVILKIGSDYYTLTPAEKRLADYILANQDGVAGLSISQMAKACGVAEATVSRFSRHMGFKGFPALKLAVANAAAQSRLGDNPLTGEITRADSLETVAEKLFRTNTEAMAQTMEVLDLEVVAQVATELEKAGRVLCMGQGGSLLIAREAAHLFTTVSNKFQAIEDSHLQIISAVTMDPGDIILFFSYSGSTKDMLDTLKTAREQGGRVVLVTRFPNSPGAELADLVLQCGANESPLQTGSVAARIAQMYLLDVLFSEYTRRNLEKASDSRARIAQALRTKHL